MTRLERWLRRRPLPSGAWRDFGGRWRRHRIARSRLGLLRVAAPVLLIGLLCMAPSPSAAKGLRLQRLALSAVATTPTAPSVRIVRVRVVNDTGKPVPGMPVRFSVIALPQGARGVRLDPALAFSGADGVAESRLTLGDRAGTYSVGAVPAEAAATEAPLVFRFPVRNWHWWLVLVVGLVGGLAIFLYGMGQASEGMTSALGRRMRKLLAQLTHNRVLAVVVGIVVTTAIQSSSATTVMLVGFVQAQLMEFVQCLGVILGAHIGTTFTTQIIAFNITEYSLVFVAVGFGMMLVPRHDQVRYAGQAVLGFGMVFFGMYVMSEAMAPLTGYEPFLRLIVALENPLLGILVGAVLTATIQASGAFIGILIVLASQGLLTLEAAVPLVLGANIGTSITAALASIPTRRAAKRVALAHTLFQVIGVILILPFLGPFEGLARWISPVSAVNVTDPTLALAAVLPRQIANAHTLFNVTMTLLFLPFLGPFGRLVNWLLPDVPVSEEAGFKTVHLDESMLATPAFALSLARAEVVRMAGVVKHMVELCTAPFVDQRPEALGQLARMEEEVNFLEESIGDYLTRISQRHVTEPQSNEAFQLMYAVTELEQIADIVTKTIRPRAQEWLELPRRFSAAGEAELRGMHLSAVKQVARITTLLNETSPALAQHIYEKYQKYRAMEVDYMRSHYERLRRAVPESLATNEFHQELMEQLVRIVTHATNIARILLEPNHAETAAARAPTPMAGASGTPPGRSPSSASSAREDGRTPDRSPRAGRER